MPRPASDKEKDCLHTSDVISGTSNTQSNKNEPGYCWMLCPYHTGNTWPQSYTGINPANKSVHSGTDGYEGRMTYHTGGRWICLDETCYYYKNNNEKYFIYSGPATFGYVFP